MRLGLAQPHTTSPTSSTESDATMPKLPDHTTVRPAASTGRTTLGGYPYPVHLYWDQDFDRRYQHLLHCLQEHGSLPVWKLPKAGDEAILDMLSHQEGGLARPDYLAIESWLSTAYIASAGDYGDPEAATASSLPSLVHQRSLQLYYCSPACTPNASDNDPQPCQDGEHRLQAVAAHHLAAFLLQVQFEAVREDAAR